MKEWICNYPYVIGFTKGMTYSTDSTGRLIDDDGDRRLDSEFYNGVHKNSFTEVVIVLDNK